jgi:hypothetical protein
MGYSLILSEVEGYGANPASSAPTENGFQHHA